MFKAIVVIVVVVAILLGGMLLLRSSRNTGMPSADVLKRAADRARRQAAKDQAER